MEENSWMSKKKYIKILSRIKNESDIDENTFNMWKSELQKELPSFWESMRR